MEVILLEKIQNLGKLGDQVKVRPGYGRNYLIPRKKAVPANTENVAKFEAQRADLESAQQQGYDLAAGRAAQLKDVELTVYAKAGTEGKLYGSVGAPEICDALAAKGKTVERREVRLPNGPLRTLGRHTVDIHLHPDINAEIAIVVLAAEAPK